jgi:hypothetical protein
MGISFAKFGFWKLTISGALVELIQLLLEFRWPQFSPRYPGPRPLAVRILLISEYALMLASLLAAVETVERILTRQWKNTHPALIVVVWMAYFCLCLWVWRR